MTQDEYIDKFVILMSEIEDNWNGELSTNFKRILFEFGERMLDVTPVVEGTLRPLESPQCPDTD